MLESATHIIPTQLIAMTAGEMAAVWRAAGIGLFLVAAVLVGRWATGGNKSQWSWRKVLVVTAIAGEIAFIVAFRKRYEGWLAIQSPTEFCITASNFLNALVETLAKVWLVYTLLMPSARRYLRKCYWIGFSYGAAEVLLLGVFSVWPQVGTVFGWQTYGLELDGWFFIDRLVATNTHALLAVLVGMARVRSWGFLLIALSGLVHFSVDFVVLLSRGLWPDWHPWFLQPAYFPYFLGSQFLLVLALVAGSYWFWPKRLWQDRSAAAPQTFALTMRLAGYLVGRWQSVILLFLIFAVVLPLALLEPFVLKYLIDDILLRGDRSLLWRAGLLIAGVLITKALLEFLGNYIAIDTARKLHLRIKMDFLRRIMRKSLAFHEETPKGTLIFSFFNDSNRLGEYISLGLINLILHGVLLVIFLAAMCWLHPGMFLLSLVVLPLQAIVLVKTTRRYERMQITMKKQDEVLTSQVEEMLSGVPTIKGFGLEELLAVRWERKFVDRLTVDFRSLILSRSASLIVTELQSLTSIAVMVWGISQVITGTLMLGNLIAFLALFGRMAIPFNYLVSSVLGLREIMVGAMRYFHLHDVPDEEAERRKPPATTTYAPLEGPVRRVIVDDITIRFPSGRQLRYPARIEFTRGTAYSWFGPNGTGKSSLAKAVCGYLNYTGGQVRFNDTPVDAMSLTAVRRRAVYLSNESLWLEDTLRTNIEIVRRDGRQPVRPLPELLAMVNADEIVATLPLGLDTVVQAGGRQFSQGERQKLALVRALYAGPEILILDEALAHLAVADSNEILDRLIALKDDILLLCICHRPDQVRRFDTVLEFPRLSLWQPNHDE